MLKTKNQGQFIIAVLKVLEWGYKLIYFMQVSKNVLREGLQKKSVGSVGYVFTSHILEIPTDFFLVPLARSFWGFP